MSDKKHYPSKDGQKLATIGGGCFWCLEAVYTRLDGVSEVISGYSGGHLVNPSYEEVTTGMTGHAEVVQITFEPSLLSYEAILEVFFEIHDPTTLNRQGPDSGTQYRSLILYHDEKQRIAAEGMVIKIGENALWNAPLVTQIEPLDEFYPAEEYHQNYFEKNPHQPYCVLVVKPKVAKFIENHPAKIGNALE